MQGVSVLLTIAWPFLVWLAVSHSTWRWLLPLATVLFILRLLAMGAAREHWLSVASWLLGNHHLLLWYPVVVNSLMLALFGGSMFSAMPLVERLARLREPDLPPRGVVWTRRVTQLW
ncbi:hypothetical protein L0F63_004954 [Massospora cicadina]|nr:hypothetical protein L0F63_004954 [Massospora cicadina]